MQKFENIDPVDKANFLFVISLICGIFIALLSIVGHFDYDDKKRDELIYCNNVKSGVWPDFKGISKEVCK